MKKNLKNAPRLGDILTSLVVFGGHPEAIWMATCALESSIATGHFKSIQRGNRWTIDRVLWILEVTRQRSNSILLPLIFVSEGLALHPKLALLLTRKVRNAKGPGWLYVFMKRNLAGKQLQLFLSSHGLAVSLHQANVLISSGEYKEVWRRLPTRLDESLHAEGIL